tara:strand:+ start:54 stop:236 length:183 start_codon:yes stop_codon:yes gene_type:complete
MSKVSVLSLDLKAFFVLISLGLQVIFGVDCFGEVDFLEVRIAGGQALLMKRMVSLCHSRY